MCFQDGTGARLVEEIRAAANGGAALARRSIDVRPSEIVASEKQRRAKTSGDRIGEAITHVELRRVARALPETGEGVERAARFPRADAGDLNAQGSEKPHHDLLRLRHVAAPLSADAKRGFEYRDRRRMPCCRVVERGNETFEPGLARQDGDDRRRVDEHHISPLRSS